MSLYENQNAPFAALLSKAGMILLHALSAALRITGSVTKKSGNAQMLPFILQVLCIKELRSLILRISSRQISSK